MWQIINANALCKVHLTPEGVVAYERLLAENRVPSVNENGDIIIQLYKIFDVFSPYLRLGNPPPFDLRILVEVKDGD